MKIFVTRIIFLISLTTSITSFAQVVDESFNADPWINQLGYKTFINCESSTISNGVYNVTQKYKTGNVTYTMINSIVNTRCGVKSKSRPSCQNNPAGNPSPDTGYVMLNEIPNAEFITSEFQNISTIDLLCSWTGSAPRGAILEKSLDGGNTWIFVDSLKGDSFCLQRGTLFNGIAINGNNVKLKIKSTQFNPQRTRIHSLKIYGTIGTHNSSIVTKQSFAINENSSIGTIIGELAVNNTKHKYSYEISAGNKNDAFTINKSNGEISVKSVLDFEKIPSYILTVHIIEKGHTEESVYLPVLITINNIEQEQ